VDSSSSAAAQLTLGCFRLHYFSVAATMIKSASKIRCPVCVRQRDFKRLIFDAAERYDADWQHKAREKQMRLLEEARDRFELDQLLGGCSTPDLQGPLPPCMRRNDAPEFKEAVRIPPTTVDAPSHSNESSPEVIARVLQSSGNPWKVLGINSEGASLSKQSLHSFYVSAKSAFRALVLQVHPDKNDHPRAADAFRAVNAAWDQVRSVLRDRVTFE